MRRALRAEAGKVTRMNSNYIGAAIDLERQLVNIEWLVAARCDLSEALGDVETNVRTVADSTRLTGLRRQGRDVAQVAYGAALEKFRRLDRSRA